MSTTADLFEESERNESASVQKQVCDGKWEKASRRAKCFDVLCVCVDENIFQKNGDTLPLARGDILLKHVKKKKQKKKGKKNERNRCACSLERSNKRALKFYADRASRGHV